MNKTQTTRIQRIIKLASQTEAACAKYDEIDKALRKKDLTDEEYDRIEYQLEDVDCEMYDKRSKLQDAILNFGEIEQVVNGLVEVIGTQASVLAGLASI